MLKRSGRCFLAFWALLWAASPLVAQERKAAELFEPDHNNRLVMRVEAAIAGAQADFGIIPLEAANEISSTADPVYAPLDEIAVEYGIVRHRMVALLNVWKRRLSAEAGNALHLGVTTVDVYDTVMVLQLLDALDLMEGEMLAIEQDLACLAMQHNNTPMIGRTLGQHALPITFGKKVSVWLAQNRRNIDRLGETRARLRKVGVLKGAVGSYLGLGDQAMQVEVKVSERLGLDSPDPADWRAARDVFGEYAQLLELIARSNASIGAEIFRLQSSDIGEVHEQRPGTAVGSSTMPHKRNPSLTEALIYYGRTVPAYADIILSDLENAFERDNTSRPNETLGVLTIEAADMLRDTRRLITRLEVDKARMRDNIDLTDGMILSQRVVLWLGQTMSREEAEHRVREAADLSFNSALTFREALLGDPVIGPKLMDEIDQLLNPETYLGLAAEQVNATVLNIEAARASSVQSALTACN